MDWQQPGANYAPERPTLDNTIPKITEILTTIHSLENQLKTRYPQDAVVSHSPAPEEPGGNALLITLATRGLDMQVRQLTDNLEAQVTSLTDEQEQLSRELGVTSTKDIVAMVRNLENQLLDLYVDRDADAIARNEKKSESYYLDLQLQEVCRQIAQMLNVGMSDGEKLRNLAQSFDDANPGQMVSMIGGLGLRMSQLQEAIKMVGEMEKRLASVREMEKQLITLYREREELTESLGIADLEALVAMIRSLECQLRDIYHTRDEGLTEDEQNADVQLKAA